MTELDGQTNGKHAYLRIADVPTKHSTGFGIAQTDREPSSLDMALRRLKDKGARVLDFWRTKLGWTIKVMVPKAEV